MYKFKKPSKISGRLCYINIVFTILSNKHPNGFIRNGITHLIGIKHHFYVVFGFNKYAIIFLITQMKTNKLTRKKQQKLTFLPVHTFLKVLFNKNKTKNLQNITFKL